MMVKRIALVLVMGLALVGCKDSGKGDVKSQEKAEQSVEQKESVKEDEQIQEGEAQEAQLANQELLNFSLENPKGKMINALDIISNNKVTIIDFWATWCSPCCAEMPNMVALYNKYHQDGLEILGVSLDRDYDEWVAGQKELGVTWPSVLDAEGMVANAFGIEFIPFTVVINSKGEILTTNLRGEELANFVAAQL